MTEGPTDRSTGRLPARDLVDVRLSAAIGEGGCAVCGVRARSERGTLDAIIAERVLDIGFREGLERDHAFCRRHARELIEADRRAAGILGSSILYGAMITRRVTALRAALGRGAGPGGAGWNGRCGGRRARSAPRASAGWMSRWLDWWSAPRTRNGDRSSRPSRSASTT